MDGNYTRDKLLGNTETISYENLDLNPNVIVIGGKDTGKTSKFVIPNARWVNSRATIIVDRGYVVRDAVKEWEDISGEHSPLEEFVFDADREDSYKFNPFTADFGDSAVKKIRHLARAFLVASKGVPQTQEFFSIYIALVCAVYFGVTTTLNDLQGLKDTLGMNFEEFRNLMSVFIKDAETSYESKPSFMKNLDMFINIPVKKAEVMFEHIGKGMSSFFTDGVLRMSDTQVNTLFKLDVQAFKMYVNIKPDRYEPTNCMFAVFLDAIMDRQIFFCNDNEMDNVITPYKHYIIDDVELIPLSPNVRKNSAVISKLGVTTSVIATHVNAVQPWFEKCDTVVLMGGTTDPEDLKFLSEHFDVSLDDIEKNNNAEDVLVFTKGAGMTVSRKLGDRGIWS